MIEGPTRLKGEVEISCSKNAYLPIMCATLLTKEEICFTKLPNLFDIRTMKRLLIDLGVEVQTHDKEPATQYFCAKNITKKEASYDLVKTMRAGVLVLGPLLARFKEARVSLPGGCAIGTRPIDIHLKALEKMNAEITTEGGYVIAKTTGLKGATITFPFPSVGATENTMMAATLAEGVTIIENAALEPEIEDLGKFLISMGAKIEGLGTSVIRIQGVNSLQGSEYQAIPDRIEAITYLMAALATKGEVKIKGIIPSHFESVWRMLIDHGAQLEIGSDYIKTMPSDLKPMVIETRPYPGFPTDAQAQTMALMTAINGSSVITENIFENRFMHVPEMMRLNAKITLKGPTAIVNGGDKLIAAPVMCTDLRASAALVLTALCAEGLSEVRRIYHLDRGYENLDIKFKALGAKIERVPE
jgi:UDP-N-acetylglucosamine 1-carboxyvinyltransferase